MKIELLDIIAGVSLFALTFTSWILCLIEINRSKYVR